MLENAHIIDKHQVFSAVITRGPSGVALNSSFKSRDNEDYKQDLGNCLGRHLLCGLDDLD